jgi:hypothetical protein
MLKVGNELIAVVLFSLHVVPELSAQAPSALTFEQFLEASVVPKEVIERFLRGPSWAQFDSELGYIPGSYLPADGMDKSSSISTVQPNGARTSFLYADKKARINTYGDVSRTAIRSMTAKPGRSIWPGIWASLFETLAWADTASIRPIAG